MGFAFLISSPKADYEQMRPEGGWKVSDKILTIK